MTATEVPDLTPLRPLWLSHHYACDADRCLHVGSVPVCRRCAGIFVGFVPVLIWLTVTGTGSVETGDAVLALGLTLVAGWEFLQVARRRMRYDPRRVLLLSPAIGAVEAWLAVTGARDGLGLAHLVAGVAGTVVLVLLLASGAITTRRSVSAS